MRGISTSRWRAGRAVLGVVVGLLSPAAAAFAAHPFNGQLYVGHLHRGSLDRLVFRVSSDGRTMRFTGRTAFTMTCYRNGRVARRFDALVVERSAKRKASAVPAPLLKIRRDGTFYGAGTHSVKPGAAPRETIHYHFAGHLTGKGTTAVGKFFANNCSSAPFQIALATPPGNTCARRRLGWWRRMGLMRGRGRR